MGILKKAVVYIGFVKIFKGFTEQKNNNNFCIKYNITGEEKVE